MSLRSCRERVVQACTFEVFGLLVASPLYGAMFTVTLRESVLVLGVMSVIVLIWCPLHNAVFDLVDFRMTGRVASARPHSLRLVHAISHEVSTTLFTLPVLLWVGDLPLWLALQAEVGLTVFYVGFAYVFYLVYDRAFPVKAQDPPLWSSAYRSRN